MDLIVAYSWKIPSSTREGMFDEEILSHTHSNGIPEGSHERPLMKGMSMNQIKDGDTPHGDGVDD